jgi:hypothetical protein
MLARICRAQHVEPAARAHHLRQLVQHHAGDQPPGVDGNCTVGDQLQRTPRGAVQRYDMVDQGDSSSY